MRHLRTWARILALTTFAVVLAGCGRSPAPEQVRVKDGRPAPEIKGEDLNGQRFKLSDYRGQVVLLSFWGNW